jgi:branched-chain amino acid transport system substrate-binding protein
MMPRFLLSALMISMITGTAHAQVVVGLPGAFSMTLTPHIVGRSAKLAVAEINAAGGLMGEQIRLIEVDDHCDAGQAVAAAEKLVAEGADFVIGHTCSDAAIPASKVYADAGIVMITPYATNPFLTEQGFANVFRLCGRDDFQGAMAAGYLARQWGDKNIAILHDGRVYGVGLAGEVRDNLNRLGVTEVLFEQFDPDAPDPSDVVDKVQAAEADVLFYGGSSQNAALIMMELRDRGDDAQLVSGDVLLDEEFSLVAGEAADGALFTGYPDPRSLPDVVRIGASLQADWSESEIEDFFSIGAPTYAAIQTWAQAVEQAGSVEPEAVIEALRSGSFDTIYGKIGFDGKGDVIGYEPFAWYVWQDGEILPTQLTN